LARLPQEKQKEVVDAIVSGNVKTIKSAQEASAFDMSEEVNVASDINFEVVDLGGIYIARHKTKDYRAKFNETNDSIKWAKWTWNPLTGCRGPGGDGKHCVYCYAKQRAENPYYRGAFPMGFAPTFYPDRLSAPQNTRIPSGREKEFGITEVFVCSMGDLFSACLPQEWIEQVLGACREAPQWNFLFLTKNPKRLTEIDFPANSWAGATVEIQSRVKTTEEAFSRVKAPIKFLSCEPLSEKLTFSALDLFDWVIIGAFKNGTQPNWEWVESLWWQARQAGCRIYIKENLTLRIQEYPD
jgi:protein gp37